MSLKKAFGALAASVLLNSMPLNALPQNNSGVDLSFNVDKYGDCAAIYKTRQEDEEVTYTEVNINPKTGKPVKVETENGFTESYHLNILAITDSRTTFYIIDYVDRGIKEVEIYDGHFLSKFFSFDEFSEGAIKQGQQKFDIYFERMPVVGIRKT